MHCFWQTQAKLPNAKQRVKINQHFCAELRELGLDWRDAAFVHLYLADMSHFGAANTVYNWLLPAVDPPGRACIQLPLSGGCPVAASVLVVTGGSVAAQGSADGGSDSAAGSVSGGSSCDGSDGSWETFSSSDAGSDDETGGAPDCIGDAQPLRIQPRADGNTSAAGSAADPAAIRHLQQTQAAEAGGDGQQQLAADLREGGGGAAAERAAQPMPRRRVLHVQSISEWAPTCIGPYSQGVATGGLVCMSGIIPLDPPTMQLIEGEPSND